MLEATIALVILVVLLGPWALRALAPRPTPVYLDKGRGSRVFVSEVDRLRSKPDLLERRGWRRRIWVIQRKSRRGRVYPSDRMQVLSEVLTVIESGTDVAGAAVELGGDIRHVVKLPRSTRAIRKELRPVLDVARHIALGEVPEASPARAKCGGCGHRDVCPHSAA